MLLLSTTIASAGFMPNVRVDLEERPYWSCESPAITVGPPLAGRQPVYVVFQSDSGIVPGASDVVFQKSTDAGVTWLTEDRVIRQSESRTLAPDVTTDPDGNIYVAYSEMDSTQTYAHLYCVRSTDGGDTWSMPVRIDDNAPGVTAKLGRLAADTAGNLFCAWEDYRTGRPRIWSSASTDLGSTWSPNARVDDDTVSGGDCRAADVFVQPGTNHFLVAATAPYWVQPGFSSSHAYLYRSTDMGQTFQPGVQLDTFEFVGATHVVADAQHVICDYSGYYGESKGLTQARTLYTPPDTWGPRMPVTDTSYNSYYCAALALSADGRIHTALMINHDDGCYDAGYAFSTNHGATWSEHERINDDTTTDKLYPDIGADSAGHVYVVWLDGKEVWFSTNNTASIAEGRVPQAGSSPTLSAEPNVFSRTTTIYFSASSLAASRHSLSIYDPSGRLVRSLPLPSSPAPRPYSLVWDGRNSSGTRCPAGLYVIRYGTATAKITLLPAD